MVSTGNLLIFFLALLCLSQSGNIAKFSNASIEVLGFWRLLIAGLITSAYAGYSYIKSIRQDKMAPDGFLSFQKLPLIGFSGFLFFTHLWTYKYAAQNTLIAHSMILFALNPLWTALVAEKLVGDKVSSNVKIASAVGFTGIVLIALSNEQSGQSYFWGNLAALLSGLLYSAYFLTSKKSRLETNNVYFIPLLFLTAAIFFGLTGVTLGKDFFPQDPRFWWSVTALIAFPTLIGHASMIYLVKRLNINWLSSGKLIEVPLATVVAFLVFDQSLSPMTLVAFCLTAISVYLLYRKS